MAQQTKAKLKHITTRITSKQSDEIDMLIESGVQYKDRSEIIRAALSLFLGSKGIAKRRKQ